MNADILVLDGGVQVIAEVHRNLESANYTVDLVEDGATAVRMAGRNFYKALLMAVPRVEPQYCSMCAELIGNHTKTPILLLSVNGGERDEVQALDAGADDYLGAPCSYDVLLARLRALIRRGQRVADRTLRVGDLWLDPARRRCGRGGRDVSLTAREFAVLTELVSRPGQVVSKSKVLEEVWDMAYQGGSAIVEVYISNLRRKIDMPFGVSSIETVRGSGYRLVPVHAGDLIPVHG